VYLHGAWGGQPLETLDKHLVGRHDRGPRREAERRHTESYVYLPKGMAFPSYWTRGDTVVGPAPPSTSSGALPAGRFVEAYRRFSLDLPDGWEQVEEDPTLAAPGGLSLRLQSSPATTLKAVMVKLSEGMELDAHVESVLAANQAAWTVEQRSKAVLARAPACAW
jgi:hypothetical protein